MTFLSPLYLVGAAAAVIPIVLHFLHREPEARVKFSAVHLLRHAPVEDARRRRLREWLLLALRIGALALLAVAFARPFFVSGSASGASRATVVAIDASLSMSAQFAHAKDLARAAIAKVPGGELVGVVTFADSVETAASLSTDRALAGAAVDGAAAGFGRTRYAAAIGAATRMIEGVQASAGTIVVVTDLQASGWDGGDRAAVPDSVRVEVADVGPAPANLAVTSVRAEADRIVATIRNAGPRTRDVHARLAVDGKDAGVAEASIAGGAVADLALPGAHGAAARVSVDDPSGIQGDNARYLVLDSAGQSSVLIVTTNGDAGREAFYAQQAVAASGSAGLVATGVSAAGLSGWSAERLKASAGVVLVSTRGLDARGRALLSTYVQQGGGVFVAAGPDVAGDLVEEILGGAVSIAPEQKLVARRFAPSDLRHPVLRAFDGEAATLGLVSFSQIAAVAGKQCATLGTFTTGEAALVDCSVGEGRALVFASDIDNRGNDFPLHATFVPFLQESLRYLSGTRPRGADVLVGEVPAGVQPIPGVSTSGTRQLAVNVDPAESETDRVSPQEFQAAVARLKDAGHGETLAGASQQESRQHLWEYALFGVLALLLAESLVAMRVA